MDREVISGITPDTSRAARQKALNLGAKDFLPKPIDTEEVTLRLYNDPVLWRRLSQAGLSLVEDKFSLVMGAEKLEEAIEKGYRKRLGLLDA